MSSFSNGSKSGVASPANESVNASTMRPYIKSGEAQAYDKDNIAYDDIVDTISGNAIYYDAQGVASVYTNESKS